MHWVTSGLGVLITLSLTSGEECVCPNGHNLVCDKTVALTLAQTCVRQCIDIVLPVAKGSAEESHPCSVREEILSSSRPAYLVDIAYHPCYCINGNHYKPVCTTHFVTYINECAMNCIKPGSKKSHDGACVSRNKALSCVSCFRNSHPVCATDGKTYPNDCMFQCFKEDNEIKDIAVKHDGSCQSQDSPYLSVTIQTRSGQKHSGVEQISLEKWLLSMMGSGGSARKKKTRGHWSRELPRNV